MTYLGNSINIAGKNRFLTSNLMFSTAEYFMQNSSDISKINTAIDQLESNILTLKYGGKISDIDLKPLPSEFSNDWYNIYQKWIELKSTLSNNILKQNQMTNSIEVGITSSASLPSSSSTISTTAIAVDNNIKTTLEAEALSLVDSSNVLVTKLGEYTKNSSQNSVFLQIFFALLNIGVTTAFILYIIKKILKPIFALTNATSEVKRGNLNVAITNKGNGVDELSILTESFNSMVTSIKNYIKKQNELKKELEKANQELKYRDKLKDEFINVAAHELKTPIQPILGLCEILRDRETNIEKDEEILDIVIRNSRRLKKLAEDILNVAKIESGSFLLKKEKFYLELMITETLKDFEQKILESKKNIKLSYESHDNNNEIIIEADRNRLCQITSNLLNNAFNFTDDGNITLIVERKNGNNNNNNNNDEILISIKDTGIGIDPEILPKLFTKFATNSSITGSTGLGLFICKSIIEMHDGKIWAINNNNNNSLNDDGRNVRGSTFTFSIPIK
jgi:signal transduction histidine kinase